MIDKDILHIDVNPWQWLRLYELLHDGKPQITVVTDFGEIVSVYHPVKGLLEGRAFLEGKGPPPSTPGELAEWIRKQERSYSVLVVDREGVKSYMKSLHSRDVSHMDIDEFVRVSYTLLSSNPSLAFRPFGSPNLWGVPLDFLCEMIEEMKEESLFAVLVFGPEPVPSTVSGEPTLGPPYLWASILLKKKSGKLHLVSTTDLLYESSHLKVGGGEKISFPSFENPREVLELSLAETSSSSGTVVHLMLEDFKKYVVEIKEGRLSFSGFLAALRGLAGEGKAGFAAIG